uniref:Leucine rich repeat containing 71 n=1 Tax=Labrus bergylta TaxID=56723 RepID=A0A3Q3GWR7_9LABR
MSRKKQKEKTEKAHSEDEASRNTDEYHCSGNVKIDFPRLCALLDIKDIPAVNTKQHISAAPRWSKPRLQIEKENADPHSTKNLKISGWKVDEQIARVLQKILPSLSRLQRLHFWQAGLTDQTVMSLINTIPLCSNLSFVTLEGNPLPEQSYHLLLSEDSLLTHLSLRNNRIGDEGARLIGVALSTTRSANRNLLSLNLSFNSIGDEGAAHIAQGLRLNRALLFLSLSNNQIGDAGAAHLAQTLGDFTLTHEEVMERRKLLLERAQSVSNVVLNDSDSCQQVEETVNPLLDHSAQYRDGELILPGNTTLISLNLAGQTILRHFF